LYYKENGLQIALKKFDEIERIFLIEFFDSDEKLLIIGKRQEGKIVSIIWDLYNTSKYKILELDDLLIQMNSSSSTNLQLSTRENIRTHLDRTSGNILQINHDGTVSSVLKKIEEKLERKEKEKLYNFVEPKLRKPNGKSDENHIIYYNENTINFEPIVTDEEPWVLGDYERTSYCLYYSEKGTEVETLQLIVGRSTVQIWHQVHDSSKNKERLPNKGEPFLEYIWTNRIPVSQERKETRLRIGEFKYGSNDGLHDKLSDFYLKVYWYIRNNDDERENIKKTVNVKMTDHEIIEENNEIHRIEKEFKKINENSEIDEKEKDKMKQKVIKSSKKLKIIEKTIKRKDIIEKFRAVRHACKALEHLNKRYKSKRLANNYIRLHKVS
jgi:hypothetical protein